MSSTPPHKTRRRDRIRLTQKARHLITMLRDTMAAVRAMRASGTLMGRHHVGARWATKLLSELGVTVRCTGSPVMLDPGLYVSNHTSYLDILVWMAATPCGFLAKASVARAPLIGAGATLIGGLYVDRSCKDSRREVRGALADAVRDGRRMVVFPEGTTHWENGSWHRGSFEVAAEHRMPVQPGALGYSNMGACAWYDDQPFLDHFLELLAAPPIEAHLHLFDPTTVSDVPQDVARIEDQVCDWVDAKLDAVGWAPPDTSR